MGYGDPKVVVQVTEREDKALEYIDPKGAKHTYYPGRRIWLDLQELQIWRHLRESKENGPPTFSVQLQGLGRLEDYSISVIGEPDNSTRVLKVFLDYGEVSAADIEAAKDADGFLFSSPLGRAFLGFNRADWEIGNKDEWWLSCYLTKETLDSLCQAVASGSAKSVKLAVRLSNLYSDDHPMAPVSSRAHLFLRPDKKDNTINLPENARGYVQQLSLAEASVDMRPVEVPEVADTEEHMEVREVPPDPVAAAIDRLAVAIAGLRTSLKWVGGIAAAALVILAFK